MVAEDGPTLSGSCGTSSASLHLNYGFKIHNHVVYKDGVLVKPWFLDLLFPWNKQIVSSHNTLSFLLPVPIWLAQRTPWDINIKEKTHETMKLRHLC